MRLLMTKICEFAKEIKGVNLLFVSEFDFFFSKRWQMDQDYNMEINKASFVSL